MRLAADEDLNRNILLGLFQRRPDLDLVRIQSAGLAGAKDPVVLEWAAREGRILLSHDHQTMVGHARDRLRAGLRMPGLFEIEQTAPIRQLIDDIMLLLDCGIEGEFEGQVVFIPLR